MSLVFLMGMVKKIWRFVLFALYLHLHNKATVETRFADSLLAYCALYRLLAIWRAAYCFFSKMPFLCFEPTASVAFAV